MSAKSKKSNLPQAGLHLLFAELLHRELDPQLRELLLQPEVIEVFAKVDAECADYLNKEWTDADYEQAAVDFCDLFILPESGSAPRAAAWLDAGGAVTAEGIDAVVSQFISEWKIEVPPSYQHLAYDHLSLIFYLSVVIGEHDHAVGEEFENAVLRPWVGQFGASLANSSSPVYRALGVMLVRF